MSGFLSLYEGTERIELGNGYWVDVRKSLSSAEWTRLQNILGINRQHVDVNARRATTNTDLGAYQAELAVLSVADWNLDEADGTTWKLEPDKVKRANIARLPSSVFIRIVQRCDELNGAPDSKEQARFPGPGGGGDPEQDGGAAGTGELPDTEGVLGAAGAG
jgi:hypothetical protein